MPVKTESNNGICYLRKEHWFIVYLMQQLENTLPHSNPLLISY